MIVSNQSPLFPLLVCPSLSLSLSLFPPPPPPPPTSTPLLSPRVPTAKLVDTGTFEEDEEVVFDDMVDEFDDEDEAIDAVSCFHTPPEVVQFTSVPACLSLHYHTTQALHVCVFAFIH